MAVRVVRNALTGQGLSKTLVLMQYVNWTFTSTLGELMPFLACLKQLRAENMKTLCCLKSRPDLEARMVLILTLLQAGALKGSVCGGGFGPRFVYRKLRNLAISGERRKIDRN